MTALTATYAAGTVSTPPRVTLAVTAAPSKAPVYSSNLATADGWTGANGTVTPVTGPTRLTLQSTSTATAVYSRTVTGLTVGWSYRFDMSVTMEHGDIAQDVDGDFPTAVYTKPSKDFVLTSYRYAFTATATSHVIQIQVKPTKGSSSLGRYWLHTAAVVITEGWGGTSITRTDANGTDIPVREGPGGQDTTGATGSATMTVTDYEAALVGSVSYTVTDGAGGTATTTVAAPTTPGVWLSLPATANPATPVPPSFVAVSMVVELSEDSTSNGTVHTIIGRADPVANPGPLATRAGTIGVWCTDYAAAAAVRALLANGDVAQLRQPTNPGMDRYLVAQSVDVTHEEPTIPTQRWVAAVTYVEVGAP